MMSRFQNFLVVYLFRNFFLFPLFTPTYFVVDTPCSLLVFLERQALIPELNESGPYPPIF